VVILVINLSGNIDACGTRQLIQPPAGCLQNIGWDHTGCGQQICKIE